MKPEQSVEIAHHLMQDVHDTVEQLIADGVDKQDCAVALGVVSEALDEYREQGRRIALQEQIRWVFGITAEQMFPFGTTVRQ